MSEKSIELSDPQFDFLVCEKKHTGFVAGFGCLHGDTKIYTEHGLMRISDISSPIRVLSWNEECQEFQLSECGGAFPKGRGNLYQISTQSGEFVSNEHHRVFSSHHKYESVANLSVGVSVSKAFYIPRDSNLEAYLKALPLNAPNCSKTILDYLKNYADEARQYGQQFLKVQDTDLISAPLKDDVHKLFQYSYFSSTLQKGVQWVQKLMRIHHGQSSDHVYMHHSSHQKTTPFFAVVKQILKQPLVHIWKYLHIKLQSLSMFLCRHNIATHFFAVHSLQTPLKYESIIQVSSVEVNTYYDMQVLNTNNYVCEDGFIHHNSGKSFIGTLKTLLKIINYDIPKVAYYLPTYGDIRDIAFSIFPDVCAMLGYQYELNKTAKEFRVFDEGKLLGMVMFRNMSEPESIVGYEVGYSLIDETDILKKETMDKAYKKILGRNRLVVPSNDLGNLTYARDDKYYLINQIDVAGTPEGYKWFYDRFVENYNHDTDELIRASTYSNLHNLPIDFIDNLKSQYHAELFEAYVNGEFINLTSGTVYKFKRDIHNTNEIIQPNDILIIGQDFNIGGCCSIVYILRGDNILAVDEFTSYDTAEIIYNIKKKYPAHIINIYPDSSGSQHSTNASKSDIEMLRSAGFNIYAKKKNPFIRDRVNATNNMLEKKRLLINVAKCPQFTRGLEQQAYDKSGKPEKLAGSGTIDDWNDAGTYPIAYLYGIIKVNAGQRKMK